MVQNVLSCLAVYFMVHLLTLNFSCMRIQMELTDDDDDDTSSAYNKQQSCLAHSI